MLAIVVKVSVFSTLSVFVPLTSTTSENFPLPPPTTLLGALSYGCSKIEKGKEPELRENIGNYSYASKFVDEIVYATASSPKPYTITKSVERIYQHPYLRELHWKRIEMAYTVGVRPVSVLTNLILLYIAKDSFSDRALKCSLGITRIGRKESIVAVDDVSIVKLEKSHISPRTTCSTRFYFPEEIARNYDRSVGMVIDMPVLSKENFGRGKLVAKPFVVPKPFVERGVDMEVNENGKIIRLQIGEDLLEVPLPIDLIKDIR